MMSIHNDMDFQQYRDHDGINASAIKKGRKSLLHMMAEMTRGTNTPSPAMLLGTNTHTAILEPERFADEVVMWEGKSRRGKAWDEFKAENESKTIVTPSELELLSGMTASVATCKEAMAVIHDSDHEVVMFWDSPEIYGAGKARMDMFKPNELWADLKTTSKIHPKQFINQAEDMGYTHQAGWAAEGMNRLGLSMDIPYYIIAVESCYPYDRAMFELPYDHVMSAREECRKISMKYRMAEKEGYFPGVAPDGIVTLPRPEWAMPKPILDFS